MKVIQVQEKSRVRNEYLFCIENSIGFTWKAEENDIRHPKHISIMEYLRLDEKAKLLGDFNETE